MAEETKMITEKQHKELRTKLIKLFGEATANPEYAARWDLMTKVGLWEITHLQGGTVLHSITTRFRSPGQASLHFASDPVSGKLSFHFDQGQAAATLKMLKETVDRFAGQPLHPQVAQVIEQSVAQLKNLIGVDHTVVKRLEKLLIIK
ncbi:MAG: hypothetical protein B7Z37_25010 [Verrucomicrobia bacterium 12-59-8]|nr:MAG: hypothetical protein B7Z37_25010 [Verrucomicrobia bacterium 12-59-8]